MVVNSESGSGRGDGTEGLLPAATWAPYLAKVGPPGRTPCREVKPCTSRTRSPSPSVSHWASPSGRRWSHRVTAAGSPVVDATGKRAASTTVDDRDLALSGRWSPVGA